ncbi:MAG TPA: G1 family glutamic endopeptidase [Verrucomicrobiae bacterium]|nr:G1 family glutamic endopeptidase [Verrucomicrobiae bacterium]
MARAFTWLSLLGVSVWLLFPTERHSSSSTPHRQYAPVIRHGTGKSANWAGYVTATDLTIPVKHSVTDVQGSWRVPTVAAAGTQETASAIWVGIDGSSDRTVEQIGTEQDWHLGAPLYYAWFEMYPARGFFLTEFPVEPGDQISAEVQFIPKNQFVLSITNLTQGVGFSITKKRSAKRTSAEWIVEAPFFRHILPLADFGSVSFTGCSTTITNVEGPINSSSWTNESITMENPLTSTVLAQTSALISGGTAFTVEWRHN